MDVWKMFGIFLILCVDIKKSVLAKNQIIIIIRMNTLIKRLFLLIAISLMFSCKNTTNKNIANQSDEHIIEPSEKKDISNPFIDIISSLNTLNLPYTFFCGAESYTWTSEYGKEFSSILPEVIIGKLPSNDNKEYVICGIVGDIIYPYLYVYDEKANRIDSLYLHISYCLGDEEVIKTNVTIINADYSISMIDTTKYIHFIQNEVQIDSISVTERTMFQNSNGVYAIKEERRYRTQ